MNTQSQRLFNHLASGGKTHRLHALIELGIFELSARVIELEHQGHTIQRKRIEVENRFGEKIKVAEYWMEHERS